MGDPSQNNAISLHRFIIAGILSALVMFALSFVLHGLVLNDLEKLSGGDNTKLYAIMGAVYLVAGVAITILLGKIRFTKGVLWKSLGFGVLFGSLVCVTCYTFNLAWFDSIEKMHLLTNLGWQVLEQGMGSLISGFILYVQLDHRTLFVVP